ncbi:unnamed protein product [Dibothriocephalus latus]|uniref:Integrase zinc-binding domain-containing protein n=1 Tax=Dibothriocephalus latus TaxID=60516 RepID=A0A3P7L7I0_DIBLA|nr:unnamed protein product [Dibothriocephalus latus]
MAKSNGPTTTQLPFAIMAYRASVLTSTGYAAFMMLTGRQLRLAADSQFPIYSFPATPATDKYFADLQETLRITNNRSSEHDRVVVPQNLQVRVLRQFYNGHPAINRMRALACSYVYWPQMDQQLE